MSLTDPIGTGRVGRQVLLGMGLVVLGLLGGCSTTPPDHDLHPVGSSSRVTTVAIHTIYRKILVPVVLNGSQPATFLLDTGASITVITPMLAKRLWGDQPPGGPKTKAQMASGQVVEVSWIRVKSIGVGSARVENFALAIYDLPPLTLGAPSPVIVDGLLGNDFVGLFTMTVDPRAGKLMLRLDLPAH